jgi:ABC-type transport system involved in multi-copper enzyme maturation permease subunit
MLVFEDNSGFWVAKAITSNIPYLNLLLLNTGQAVIAIFLASDFLKRDKKLDTSEVFYVRPLSNAEYVIGKIWGNLRVFLILNLIVMVISLIITFMSPGVSVDWWAYLTYFLIISIPTLIFIIGLSIFLMLVLKNQALTFILLLGYIGLTLFYINDKFYYLFDYMAYYLPLVKSTIVGFTNLETVVNHRTIYLCAGLGFIFITISLFRRLPNSSRSNYPWLILAVCMLLICGFAGFRHVHSILGKSKSRISYTEINNKYVQTPKMIIDRYDISVTQHPGTFSSETKMKGIALQDASVFTFCLNPGLQVQEIREGERILDFNRDHQIILIDFGKEIIQGDSVSFSVKYSGQIDNSFCYLDIPPELLQQHYRYFLFGADKQYSFQTPEYCLFTPETYWYPRPGTAFSDKSADWQQNYFSKYHLTVSPLPGLTPLSQGEGTDHEDGTFSFSPEYQIQAISLAIGKYKQKSVEADSISYRLWYIDGHDYFSAAFDSIPDTIPTLIQNTKENLERTYRLDYPFKRFSVIEVPALFYCYPHTWTEAQEVVQPEITFFTEKGWLFDQMDFMKRRKDQKKWAKWNGKEINDEEAQIRTFNDAIRIFMQTEGASNYSDAGRGQYNITRQANPYFQFPQLYNFRYNIFSPEWPFANRIIELYLQNKQDNSNWEREINGISNNEKASLLMEKHNLKELLSDVEYKDLTSNIISLKANRLFANSEISIGVNAFRDSVYAVLKRNTFNNFQFEGLLDYLGEISETDIRSYIPEWNHPTPLPFYSIGTPNVTSVNYRGQESFVFKLLISNHSDHDGIVHLNINVANQHNRAFDPRSNRKVAIGAHQTKELVSVWDDAPRNVNVNTMISGNLPNNVWQQVRNINQERGRQPETDGDRVVPDFLPEVYGEVIVDNEDSLFSLSDPVIMGFLPKWLDKVEDTSFKYSGFSWWRPPLQWTATTNMGYYGEYIRSAYVIKSGSGNQTATWKVPVPSPGHYEVYYYMFKNHEMRNDRNNAEYKFKVLYDNEIEDAYINLRRANEGWEQLGVYYFSSDTIRVILTNESKLRSVTADAVKIVKR